MFSALLLASAATALPAQCPTCPVPSGGAATATYSQAVPPSLGYSGGAGLQFSYGGGFGAPQLGGAAAYGVPSYGGYAVPGAYAAAPSGGCFGSSSVAFGYAPPSYGFAPQSYAAPPSYGYAPQSYAVAPPAVFSYEPRLPAVTIPYGAPAYGYPARGHVRTVYRQRW